MAPRQAMPPTGDDVGRPRALHREIAITGVRLGSGEISVHPGKLAVVGHGFGGGRRRHRPHHARQAQRLGCDDGKRRCRFAAPGEETWQMCAVPSRWPRTPRPPS